MRHRIAFPGAILTFALSCLGPALGEQAAGADFWLELGWQFAGMLDRGPRVPQTTPRAHADQSIAFLDMARRCRACG